MLTDECYSAGLKHLSLRVRVDQYWLTRNRPTLEIGRYENTIVGIQIQVPDRTSRKLVEDLFLA